MVRKVNEHVDQVINEVATHSIANQQIHLQDDVKTVVSIPEPQLAMSVPIGNESTVVTVPTGSIGQDNESRSQHLPAVLALPLGDEMSVPNICTVESN